MYTLLIHDFYLGLVDWVPGLFYVKTHFKSIGIIPVIPMGSVLIYDGTEKDGGFQGVKIPLSVKSVLCAWLRTACGLALFICLLTALYSALVKNEVPTDWQMLCSMTVAAIGFLALSTRLSKPTWRRALKLARYAGTAPEELARVMARKLTEAELKAIRDQLAQR